MLARIGNVILWASFGFAALCVNGGIKNHDMTMYIIAAIGVLFGFAIRYILAGK